MKQAQQMQKKMEDMQKKVDTIEIEGNSGGGMVRVVMNGKGDVLSIKIDPSLLKEDENEMLEDLIIAACHDTKNKVNVHVNEEMAKITGGMSLPSGFKLPF
jgi:DNA-binding YbaB/EbfC family protein